MSEPTRNIVGIKPDGTLHKEPVSFVLMLGEAFKIAVEVHDNQRDKSGEPILFHVMRVASAMDTDTERCVAILHDVIEDVVPNTSLAIARLCMRIESIYGETIANAVADLTRMPNQSYMDYIRRLSRNPLAVKVKLADLAENMRRDRMRKLPPKEANRLYDRYHEAFCFLTGEQWKHEDAAEDAARNARFDAQRTAYQRADGTLHTDKEEYDRAKHGPIVNGKVKL